MPGKDTGFLQGGGQNSTHVKKYGFWNFWNFLAPLLKKRYWEQLSRFFWYNDELKGDFYVFQTCF